MIKKRVLIGSFILIITGLFFMLGANSGITGAAIGISTGALNPASSTLFGFFLIWIAGIMLIGTIDEKVTTKVIKEREKKVKDFLTDQSQVAMKSQSDEIEKTGKKLHELTQKEKLGIAGKIYETLGKDYTDNFLKLKSTEYFGNAKIKKLYMEDAKVSEGDIKNLSTLTIEGLNNTYMHAKENISEGLFLDVLSDVHGNEKNIGYLGAEFQERLGIKKSKVKTGQDVVKLYNILLNQEKDKKSKEETNKKLDEYK